MMRQNRTFHTGTGGTSRRGGILRAALGLAFAMILLVGTACGSPAPSAETTPPPQEPPPGQPPAETTEPPAPPAATEAPPPAAPETESPYAEGSMVRASYDPAANWGSPDVHEDFEGASGLFADRSGETYASWYGEGLFNITFSPRGWWTWFFGDAGMPLSFYADVVVINGDQCVDRDSGGLLFRGEQAVDFGWLFGVTCQGGYYIGVSGGPGATGPVCMLMGSTLMEGLDCSGLPLHNESEYIQAGPGAVNRLGVLADGQSYDFYINGHHVGSFHDGVTPFVAGYPALFLGAGQPDNSAVSFDDFSLWRNP